MKLPVNPLFIMVGDLRVSDFSFRGSALETRRPSSATRVFGRQIRKLIDSKVLICGDLRFGRTGSCIAFIFDGVESSQGKVTGNEG